MLPATPLEDLLEKDWETQIIGTAAHPGLARQLGWRVYHTLRSKGSEPGYPDWTLVRERVVFLELKREQGRLSDAQKAWLEALWDAGAEVYVARPRHLNLIAHILADRRPGMSLGSPNGERAKRELETELRREIA